jgi:hypothetical protein
VRGPLAGFGGDVAGSAVAASALLDHIKPRLSEYISVHCLDQLVHRYGRWLSRKAERNLGKFQCCAAR